MFDLSPLHHVLSWQVFDTDTAERGVSHNFAVLCFTS